MSVTSLLRTEMAVAMALALALVVALLALRPGDRTRIRNALLLLGVCAFAVAADGLFTSLGGRRAAAIAADIGSVLIGIVLIRLAVIFTFHIVLPGLKVPSTAILEELVTLALCVAWLLIWLRMAGVELASLVATSAVVTAVLAFSMQETLGNVLGGILLQLDHSIRLGDWVRVEDTSGRVIEIGWRHTALETNNRETVMVPNGWLMKNRFTVIGSRLDAHPVWRRWIRVNVDFSASPTQVCAVLENAVIKADIPHVARDPAPTAVLMEIHTKYGGYALRYWLDEFKRDDSIDSLVRAHLLAALQRHGMKLGAPYQEELPLKDDDAHRAMLQQQELARRREALRHVTLFASLSEAELEQLVGHLVAAPFVAGATLTRQGAVAHWLYIIVSGEADVWYEGPAGARTPLATLGAGDVFGEMGMMTGDPRRATVTARTDVQCYRLDKQGFESVIRARPDIAEAISLVLAERRIQLEGKAVLANATGDKPRHADILAKIRAFFALG
jgi:small-conductance mechanosensitive channel/CRP-like cAMP-binding protein